MPNKKGMKPERLKRIKELIEVLSENPLTQPELGGVTGLSNGAVRKDLSVLSEAKILVVKKIHVLEPRLYSLTTNKAVLDQFISDLDEQIRLGEAAPIKIKAKEEIPVVIGLRFAHHLVAPGRTIYRALDTNE